MQAVTWHGRGDIRVETVPDPTLEESTDAIIRLTSTALCGSDLHLSEVLAPFMTPGDVIGHEPIGTVEEVGTEVSQLSVGERVVIPFNVCCGHCWMCERELYSQCETTQNREYGTGASLFGYGKLYGQVPGAQAEYLRVPYADFLPIRVPEGPGDDRFLFLSDVLPTAWQAVEYAEPPQAGTVVVVGLGPIGDMATRIARHHGSRVIGVDLVPERLARVQAHGTTTIDLTDTDDVAATVREATDGRGADAVIDAVGMEAHGSAPAKLLQRLATMMPSEISAPVMQKAGIDRLAALHTCIDAVRRGGVLSIAGVYGGMTDPLPMLTLFDKQLQIRMGQANVKRWVPDIMPLLADESDPLGVDRFATHHLPLDAAPGAYDDFQKKNDGTIKVVFTP